MGEFAEECSTSTEYVKFQKEISIKELYVLFFSKFSEQFIQFIQLSDQKHLHPKYLNCLQVCSFIYSYLSYRQQFQQPTFALLQFITFDHLHNKMNTKILIQTLTEVPDLELLQQLENNLKLNGKIIVPDLRKFFQMLRCLLGSKSPTIVKKTIILIGHVNNILLATELQICWNSISSNLILLLGQEDDEIRKKAKSSIIQFLNLSNHGFIVLQKLYEEGLENQGTLVMINSMKLIFRVLEDHHNILEKKTSINIVKMILEKIVRMTSSQNKDLSDASKQFLDRLFYLKISSMSQILQRLDKYYLLKLQKLWQKNKEQLLYKNQQSLEIKYQHLPLIGDKIFGFYDPFVIKNIFNPENSTTQKFSIKQFKDGFLENEDKLIKYVNMISKIIIRILPRENIEIIQLLRHILGIPGVINIINLSQIIELMVDQVACEHVVYRREVRECLKKLNFLTKNTLVIYERKLLSTEETSHYNWIQVYEIMNLIEHWAECKQAADCYPPTFDISVCFSAANLKNKTIKIRQKCSHFLFLILNKYPTYRETLEEQLTYDQISQIQDEIQAQNKKIELVQKQKIDAKNTFVQEYNEERRRYLQTKK